MSERSSPTLRGRFPQLMRGQLSLSYRLTPSHAKGRDCRFVNRSTPTKPSTGALVNLTGRLTLFYRLTLPHPTNLFCHLQKKMTTYILYSYFTHTLKIDSTSKRGRHSTLYRSKSPFKRSTLHTIQIPFPSHYPQVVMTYVYKKFLFPP